MDRKCRKDELLLDLCSSLPYLSISLSLGPLAIKIERYPQEYEKVLIGWSIKYMLGRTIYFFVYFEVLYVEG